MVYSYNSDQRKQSFFFGPQAPASWLASQLATSQSCVSSCGASKAPPRFAASAPSTRRFRRGAINQVQLVA